MLTIVFLCPGGFVWESYDSQTFIGAEVFALINFIILLFFAVTLVILQNGVTEQLGMSKLFESFYPCHSVNLRLHTSYKFASNS